MRNVSKVRSCEWERLPSIGELRDSGEGEPVETIGINDDRYL